MKLFTILPLASLAFAAAIPKPEAITNVEASNSPGPHGTWHKIRDVDVEASNSPGPHGTWHKRDADVDVEASNSPGSTIPGTRWRKAMAAWNK